MLLRLHHAPLACSLASRLALIESALPHEVSFVRTWKGEQSTDAYKRINPRAKVPALETDYGVLTESTAILPYIADLAPQTQLLPPPGTFARARAQAWLSFMSSSLHSSFSAVIHPLDGCESEAASQSGLARLLVAYSDVDNHLDGREYVLDTPSVCDLYLFVFALWRAAPELIGKMPELKNLDAFQQKMLSRPALAAAVREEVKMRAEAPS